MVLRPDREPLVGWVKAGSFRDGPAQENALKFKPEVIMQTRRIVFLDQIRQFFLFGPDPSGRWFGCLSEIPFTPVFFKCHVIRRCSRR